MKKKIKPRFAQIPKEVIYSAAFRSLSGKAPHLLLMAACEYLGRHTNGDIAIPYTRYKEYGFSSRATMGRALFQLVDRGLLIVTRQGGRTSSHLPNLYALGWLPIPENPKLDVKTPMLPSQEWRKYGNSPS